MVVSRRVPECVWEPFVIILMPIHAAAAKLSSKLKWLIQWTARDPCKIYIPIQSTRRSESQQRKMCIYYWWTIISSDLRLWENKQNTYQCTYHNNDAAQSVAQHVEKSPAHIHLRWIVAVSVAIWFFDLDWLFCLRNITEIGKWFNFLAF